MLPEAYFESGDAPLRAQWLKCLKIAVARRIEDPIVPATCQVGEVPNFGKVVPCVFTRVLAKHSKSFSLLDWLSFGVDRMQWNFEPMRKQVEAWRSGIDGGRREEDHLPGVHQE
jgi:hypothetical protein